MYGVPIPDICHGLTDGVRGEKICHVEKTDLEKSEISSYMCTIYGIFLHFKLFCCKICVFFCALRCFVAKLVCCDLRAFVWRKFLPKIVSVDKNDKYQVWVFPS